MDSHNAIFCQKVYTDETVCEECELYSKCTHETQADIARLAIAALEKQIPKKYREIYPCKSVKYYQCPCCDGLLHINENYCGECGQAIDWSDTD